MAYTAERKAEMLNFLNWHANAWWKKAQAKFGSRIGKIPSVALNTRLTSTAGRAWLKEGKTDFSAYLLERNAETFRNDTIPHELAHIIAYRLHGSERHDKAWYAVFGELVERDDVTRCHSMVTKHKAQKMGIA